MTGGGRAWRLSPRERAWIAVVLAVVLIFGAVLERRTALRRMPMTDLGVFCAAAAAVRDNEALYSVTDWHGWHYQYPPALAVVFRPFALHSPSPPPLTPDTSRTAANTPWPYPTHEGRMFYGLHRDNFGFFMAVLVWYMVSVAFTISASHLLGCTLEGTRWCSPPPRAVVGRRNWWRRRILPLLLCLVSVGSDFSRGQVDTLMLLAIAAGLYLMVNGRNLWAGVWISIPTVIKLFPPLVLLLPLWQRSRSLAIGSALGLALSLGVMPLLAMGPDRMVSAYAQWLEVLAKPAMGTGKDVSRARELTNVNATDNQSLLAFLHNWSHHHLPREQRPLRASQEARLAVYLLGTGMLVAWIAGAGLGRPGSPRQLLIVTGTLIGAAFVVSPTVHQFYYLMLLPLFAALVDVCLERFSWTSRGWFAPSSLGLFFVVDVLARLPGLGPSLKDWGLPLISILGVMLAGLQVLRRERLAARGVKTNGADVADGAQENHRPLSRIDSVRHPDSVE